MWPILVHRKQILFFSEKLKIRKAYLIFFSLLLSGLMGLAQDDSCACCTENHTAFDFWIGTWEVTNPDGSLAGKNTITKAEDGCVLKESWTSANAGYTGTSINFYNKIKGQWEQLWIDNTGAHLKLKGNRQDNRMILSSGEFKNKDGIMIRNRITWTINDDGTVRQLWEVLRGDTVLNIAFDGLYRKV